MTRQRIVFPGQWRPHYPWEQIAWLRPPWTTRDSVWLDFPEAIFCDAGLLFLSHVNPRFPQRFPDLPRVPWTVRSDVISYRRDLPNGVAFGGSVAQRDEYRVAIELFMENGGEEPLRDIRLQTCLFLRACKEFGAYTGANKRVHVPGRWVTLEEAIRRGEEADDRPGATYRVGWRRGALVADQPWVVTLSDEAERLVAMSWRRSTFSIVGNPEHPCMHADPFFEDIEPGATATVAGEIVFFDGGLAAFEDAVMG